MTDKSTLWTPSEQDLATAALTRYQSFLNRPFKDYQELHRWSVEQKEEFWKSLLSFFDCIYEGKSEPVYCDDGTWFPHLRLNYAEHLLRERSETKIALNFCHESGFQEKISYAELNHRVAELQECWKELLQPGDVVAALMPNCPDTVIAMLAAVGLGASFSSCSCDLGLDSVLDRFQQCKPKILVTVPYYTYKGKIFDLQEKVEQVKRELPSLERLEQRDFLQKREAVSSNFHPLFRRLAFSHPLFIVFSSGTTGKPKCMVHTAGGTLLQHLKELVLHSGVTSDNVLSYFTTCSWMMWNWSISALALGAELLLYEGAPASPTYLECLAEEKVSVWGTSAKFLRVLEQSDSTIPEWPKLRCILSTGSPLMPEQFDYVYRAFPSQPRLSSICGGTDILSCFMLGNPLLPVQRGEIQCLGLGMDVAAFNDEGAPVYDEKAELVCRQPAPCMPSHFLGDEGGERYREAYYQRFPGVWAQGDFVCISPEGTVRVYGRSDCTLNPGGVRIGTAEIYRQVDKIPYVKDSICTGKDEDGDVRVILFVQMHEAEELSEERVRDIKTQIRNGCSARHVPHEIIEVEQIPYTPNGKKREMDALRFFKEQLKAQKV